MALNLPGLEAELLATRSNTNNVPPIAGQKTATAIANFWTTGLGPGGAAVIGAPAGPIMTPGIIGAYSVHALAAINAKKIATAIDTAALALILVGGVYGAHIAVTTPGPSGLASGLQRVWESQAATPALVAKKEATEINNYTLQLIANGSGIPAVPIPPQTGPFT